MVNLRKEFNSFMNENGVRGLIIDRDEQKKCNCVDSLTLASKDSCGICLGTGFISKIRIVDLRTASMETSLSSTQSLNPSIGSVATLSRYFYLLHDDPIKAEDLIVLCDWDGDSPVINNRAEICKVTYVDPMRGDNGRVEYLRLVTYTDPVNREMKLHSLKTNSGKSQYYLGVK